jgi:biopolymer transport protein ExbD
MRRRRCDDEDESPLDLTPMLDVVFILLIFFIVTASFVRETGVPLLRPQAASAETAEKARILVGIDAKQQIWINHQPLPLTEVRSQVVRLHLEYPHSGALVLADKAVATGLLVQVMDQIRLAGISQVAVAARKAP